MIRPNIDVVTEVGFWLGQATRWLLDHTARTTAVVGLDHSARTTAVVGLDHMLG